ncbi:uncharacterized protein [Nicotiana sylvestris]|uniref:uncharacterized protein n=1 Tax=Nicotiana sylvestris TaxID=4096 RepID=UPI00388CD1E3
MMKDFIVKKDKRLDVHGASIQNLGNGKVLKDPTPIQKEVVPENESREHLKNDVEKKKKGKKGTEKKNKGEILRREEYNKDSKHMPALAFPPKLSTEKLEKQFERFPDMLRQVNVNFPFAEILSQITSSAKFLKEILTKKMKIEETSVVKLIEHCSAFLHNKLPQKYGYPGSFTIPCSLGTLNFDKSLCDVSASINLMPLSIYKKLDNEIGEIRSAHISLQLTDKTSIIPEGIVEDFVVWVDKFVFPVEFIVMKMEEKKEVPLILGRQFLATGRAILNIHDRKIILSVGEETVTFEMNVEMSVKKEKSVASVKWKVLSTKKKAPVIEKHKCGVYPKKVKKNLSA